MSKTVPESPATTRHSLADTLRRLGACTEAVQWVGRRTLRTAWRDCPRGDWMLWLADRLGIARLLLVRAACACARTACRHADGATLLAAMLAVHVAEEWAAGRADFDDVRAAAAAVAAYAAYAAAAAAAAYAAADAVADAAAAAYNAAYDAANRECAGLVRDIIPYERIAAALAALSQTETLSAGHTGRTE